MWSSCFPRVQMNPMEVCLCEALCAMARQGWWLCWWSAAGRGVIAWPTPCSRVEQEQQVMRYPTPLLLVGWVGLEMTDAESHWRDVAGRSEKGTLWIMLWTWSSGHLFSHLCHRAPPCPWARQAAYPPLISPVRKGDGFPPARCCEAPWSCQLP